jgi:leucyl aminopeptidase
MIVKIKTEKTNPSNKKTQMLCTLIFEKSNEPLGLGKFNSKINAQVKQSLKEVKQSLKEIKGKIGDLSIIQTLDEIPAQKILIAGLGPKNKITLDVLRRVSGIVAQKARSMRLAEFSIIIPENFPLDVKSLVSAIVEGTTLSMYSFNKYKKEKNEKSPNLSILISKPTFVQDIISKSQIISDGVIFTKSIANLPPNDCSPTDLASYAKSIARKNKLTCKVFSKKELKEKKFGGIIAVGKGSINEPKLIVLEHQKGKRNDKPIVIVGKAVTFDTGGISLKPSEKMNEMKFDKCGGCTVLGIMKIISELKLPLNVVGIIPSVENMPGRESYRPGDIVRLYSGNNY